MPIKYCSSKSTKDKPQIYSRDELEELAFDNGLTISEVKELDKKSLCKELGIKWVPYNEIKIEDYKDRKDIKESPQKKSSKRSSSKRSSSKRSSSKRSSSKKLSSKKLSSKDMEDDEQPKSITNLDEYISFRSPKKKDSPKKILENFSKKTKNIYVPSKDVIEHERYSSLSKNIQDYPVKRMLRDEILSKLKSKEDKNYVFTQNNSKRKLPNKEESIDEESIDEESIDEESIDEESSDEESSDEESSDEESSDEESSDEESSDEEIDYEIDDYEDYMNLDEYFLPEGRIKGVDSLSVEKDKCSPKKYKSKNYNRDKDYILIEEIEYEDYDDKDVEDYDDKDVEDYDDKDVEDYDDKDVEDYGDKDYIMVDEEYFSEDYVDVMDNICEMKNLNEFLFKNHGLISLYSDEDLAPCVKDVSKKYLSLSSKNKIIFVVNTGDDIEHFKCFSKNDEMYERYKVLSFSQFVERYSNKIFPEHTFLIIQNGLYFSSDVYDNKLQILPSEIGIYCAKKAKKVLIFTKNLFEYGIGDMINMISMARGTDPISRDRFVTEYNLDNDRFIRKYFRCIFYISDSYIKQLEDYQKHITIEIIPFLLDIEKSDNLLIERKKIDLISDILLNNRKNLVVIDKSNYKIEEYLKFKFDVEGIKYKIVTNIKKKDKIINKFNKGIYDTLVLNIHTPMDVSNIESLDNLFLLDSLSNLNKKITLINRIKSGDNLNIIHFVHSNFCNDNVCEMSKDEKNVLEFLNKIRSINIRNDIRVESVKYSVNVGTGCNNQSFWGDIFENTFNIIF